MFVFTPKEKKAVFVLIGCLLLGVVLYWVKERELALGREFSVPSQISQASQKTVKAKKDKININKASLSELESIPGIGPYLAQNILNYRKQNRRFYQLEQLKEVKGIGEKRFLKLVSFIEIR